jgi:hypothetical protein
MKPGLISRSMLILALAVATAVPRAWAGPEEDFQAGEKSYRSGDVTNAMSQLRKAADAGHAKAQARLAEILDASDYNEEAFAYYRKSADQGDVDGVFGLASMYSVGEGVKKDPVEAYKLYVLADEKGHPQAYMVIASAYIFGQLGIDEERRNSEEAARWMKLAADRDFLPAVEALAKAYRVGGFGVAPDAKQADEWDAKLKRLRRDGGAAKKP